jgi:hypothetical protein
MLKFATALSAALIAGWALVGSATDASARGYRGHGCCGPIPPKYTHSTRTVHKHVRQYRDVHRTKYVKRIKRIIHVTRIQPVIHVHRVTRVHTRLVGVVHPVHQRVTQVLPPRHYVTGRVVYLPPRCACSYGHHGGYGRY